MCMAGKAVSVRETHGSRFSITAKQSRGNEVQGHIHRSDDTIGQHDMIEACDWRHAYDLMRCRRQLSQAQKGEQRPRPALLTAQQRWSLSENYCLSKSCHGRAGLLMPIRLHTSNTKHTGIRHCCSAQHVIAVNALLQLKLYCMGAVTSRPLKPEDQSPGRADIAQASLLARNTTFYAR